MPTSTCAAALRAAEGLLDAGRAAVRGLVVADGRPVPPGMVAHAVIWSGGVWTGFVGLIGWLIFRGRELARVTV